MSDMSSANILPNGFELLKFETSCYFQFLKLLLELFGKEKAPIKFGVEQGFDSFIGFSAQLDCSVFLYEALTFFESIAPGTVKEIAATRSWIKAIYLTNSGALGMTEFLEQKDSMIAEMYCLQRAIQDCFSLNKSYG